ncbi:MAG TPA: ATP-binding protein [Gemmataceae bacterium]|nr:ATP-binding protein [Gemmataceae bacterium]
MTLTARLSLFSLAALAAVLVGFSAALYLLARTYLYRQADERLGAALNTLAAVAEVKPDGVEWETHDRFVVLGPKVGSVCWCVCDGEGRPVDASRDDAPEEEFSSAAAAPDGAEALGWRLAQRRLEAGKGKFLFRWGLGHQWWLAQHRPEAARGAAGQGNGPDEGKKYDALVLTVGVRLAPLRAALRNLALTLAGLSVGVWLLAALAARRLCRRALAPLTGMAEAARAMSAAEVGRRLPSSCTGDELDDLGRAFNDLLARREEAFERQRRFTGDASHQLRTPLTALLGQAEVALLRPRSPEEYRRVLELVRGQAGGLRRIVESLLFLARADADAQLPDLEVLDLAAWLPEHLRAWPDHGRGADLRLDVRPGPLRVRAQAALLGQLLDNLLDNACKYSERGTPITLAARAEGGVVALSVEDAGGGIAGEDLPHVFEPFYRSPDARQRGVGGVGLGLAVARRIAAAFGGSLDVQSRSGQGTRLTLRLPEAEG